MDKPTKKKNTSYTLEQAKERIKKLAKAWIDYRSKVTTHGYCGMTWGEVIDVNGSVQGSGNPGGCHGYINQAYAKASGRQVWDNEKNRYVNNLKTQLAVALSVYIGPSFAAGNTYGKGSVPEDVQKRWISWFVSKDNPLSKHIMEKDVDFIYNYGLIVDLTTATHAEALWLCKALRQSNETPSLVMLWDRLVKDHGIDPLLAMWAAHMFPTGSANFRTYAPDGHRAVFLSTRSDVQSIITRVVHPTPSGNTTGAVFCKPAKIPKSVALLSSSNKIDNGWGGVSVVSGCTEQALVDALKTIEKEVRDGVVKLAVRRAVTKLKSKPTIKVS